jgi:hypothetical protein
MSDAPDPKRTRFAAVAGLLGATAVAALLLGAGPAPSALQLAGASNDDAPGDISGNCDEAEHAGDPECVGTPTGDSTSTTVDDSTSTTTGSGVTPPDEVRSLDAAGAGTVVYAVEGGNLRLITATPASGWAVEVEQGAGREVELDFRSGTKRVQVNLEIEDGEVRERVRFRDDADDTDIRTENGVVDGGNSGPGSGDDSADDNSNSGPGRGSDDDSDDDSSGSGHEDSDDDSNSGSGRDHPEDD